MFLIFARLWNYGVSKVLHEHDFNHELHLPILEPNLH